MSSDILLEKFKHYPAGPISMGQLALWAFPRPADGYRSTFMYEFTKHALEEGKEVIYMDCEGSIDPKWLQAIDINNQEK